MSDRRMRKKCIKPIEKGVNANIANLVNCIVKNAELFNVPTMYYIIYTNSMHWEEMGNRIWKTIIERSAKLRAESNRKTRDEVKKEVTVLKVLIDGWYETDRGEIRY